MEEYKINSLERAGRLIIDPTFVFEKVVLINPDTTVDIKMGTFDLVGDHFGYLFMRNGVSPDKLGEFLLTRQPKVYITNRDNGKTTMYYFSNGRWRGEVN